MTFLLLHSQEEMNFYGNSLFSIVPPYFPNLERSPRTCYLHRAARQSNTTVQLGVCFGVGLLGSTDSHLGFHCRERPIYLTEH